ncbi:MAG: polyphenol oxidase family protein, partial [Lachnospiraceae bacterium]|nr:polyphenol oxidase family protein [Lachnospiraceae bacterium]
MNNMLKKKSIAETTTYIEKDNVGFFQYKKLNEFPWLMNAFSTRKGGVSKDQYAEMNLSFTVGDDPEIVKENFRIFGDAIGVKREQMVYAAQTHTGNVMRVDSSFKGMGILRDRNFDNIDGLVTDDPGVCLVGSYADCVPLYFVDPVKRCIGLSHSGWRGTVTKIGRNTIELMRKEFGTDPADLICCIGPCIGKE